ncbi:unnamed protein product [Darwinula stevensoni]|uniref:Ig-like domain-containing protein n=1 Tax=Darwinula stevensoni TaxID=69355 RepID=A0A7R9A350_9CRUS|nr:unnamed protein product [Darwinula stevensoni]CAG0890010.1 unnamed protein product [Darwinula stevensoni]
MNQWKQRLRAVVDQNGGPDRTSLHREEPEPTFVDKIENQTVPAGRDVVFSCRVTRLGSYKVAWIHAKQAAILTVKSHVITRNPRISVTHGETHLAWHLHITDVQPSDAGGYMCQINTLPPKSITAFLHVVVPPEIVDTETSKDLIVRENSNVSLTCKASGSPPPSVYWERQDGAHITLNRTHSVLRFDGEVVNLVKVDRKDMGVYLCKAQNGVPPIRTKRVKVNVDFPPYLWIQHQLVGAPLHATVTLECQTEAHPDSINSWTREDGNMITADRRDAKYTIDVITTGQNSYQKRMQLTIHDLQKTDFGTYHCLANNSAGDTQGSITLEEKPSPLTTESPKATSPDVKGVWGTDEETNDIYHVQDRDKPHENGGKRMGEEDDIHRQTFQRKRKKTHKTQTDYLNSTDRAGSVESGNVMKLLLPVLVVSSSGILLS